MKLKISYRKLSIIAAILTALVGLIVFIGWQFDISTLKSFHLSTVDMMANTAIAFLLCGFALIFLQYDTTTAKIIVRFSAIVTALIGALTLFQYLFGWNFGIDQLLLREQSTSTATSHPGRMAPNTALNFLLVGFALFLLTLQKFRTSFLVEFPLIFSLSISVLGFVGYFTGLTLLTGPFAYTQMAANTSCTFMILCFGMIFTCYERQRVPITIEQKLFAGLTTAIAIIIFITFLSISGVKSLVQANDWAEHTQTVKNQIGGIFTHVLEVQSGDRGFVLTGDDNYLVAHNKALDELPSLLYNIRSKITSNPQQQKMLASLEKLVGERMAFSSGRISTRRTDGEAKARLLFPIGGGKMITDSIRVLVAQMIAEEDRLLQIRNENEKVQTYHNLLIIYHSLAVQVLLLVFIFVFVKRDIAGRKVAEEETRRTKDLIDSVVENIPTMIFLKDAKNLRFSRFNKAGEDLIGYSREELIGKNDYDFFPKNEADFFTSKDREVLAGSSVVDIPEEPIQTKHKGQRILHTRKVPLRNENGKVKYLLGISEDITELKNAEKTLQKLNEELDDRVKERTASLAISEARYRTTLDNMMEGAQIIGFDWYYLYINVSAEKHNRRPKEELLGNRYMDIWPGIEATEVFSKIKQCMEERITYHMENKFTFPDGTFGWFDLNIQAVPEGVFILSIDITERKRTENVQIAIYRISEATQSAYNLNELYQQIHAIINELMPAKNFYIAFYDSESNLLHFPYHADEFDTDWEPLKPGKSLTAYVLRTGNPLLATSVEFGQLINSGEIELIGVPSIDWLGVPLKTKQGKPIGVIVVQTYTTDLRLKPNDMKMLEFVSTQITMAIEHKQAEESLRKNEEQFRLISENIADLIAVLDLEGRRVYNSPMYKNIIGDPKELRGTDSFQEIHPDDRDRIKAVFHETIKTGIGQRTEYRFMNKDGKISYIESQGSVIRDNEGKITNVVVVSRDVTEKKQLEQQFMRMQRMESIGTLAGGVAHDLNNVLAPILLSIDLLRKTSPDKRSQKMLETLETSALRGSAIVKQILGFARGIQGETALIQIRHIINEMVNIIKETFPKSIIVKEDIPKNIWTIVGDPTNLHQVILNLCVNARDAMPNGGIIHIRAENKIIDEHYTQMNRESILGQYVMLSVEDTGCGIPPKVLEHIFEPFFTTKEIGKGTGLGLSTVHSIVKNHDGFINVYSEVGKGTTFRVYLPAAKESGDIEKELKKSLNMFMGHEELILVVDDEYSIQQITKNTLEVYGYRTLTASDGTEAIAQFASRKDEVALVLTDMIMPVMDGQKTIQVLRKMNPKIKIIASSGLAGKNDVVVEKGLAVDAFLVKPYNAEKLLETVYSVLHKK